MADVNLLGCMSSLQSTCVCRCRTGKVFGTKCAAHCQVNPSLCVLTANGEESYMSTLLDLLCLWASYQRLRASLGRRGPCMAIDWKAAISTTFVSGLQGLHGRWPHDSNFFQHSIGSS